MDVVNLSQYRAILGGEVISNCMNNSGKRNGVDHRDNHLGVSTTMKMKKMKGRKKVREPRFCFKTLSTDVDVLDDGYKWRKYGQKVVKNTQHPRYMKLKFKGSLFLSYFDNYSINLVIIVTFHLEKRSKSLLLLIFNIVLIVFFFS